MIDDISSRSLSHGENAKTKLTHRAYSYIIYLVHVVDIDNDGVADHAAQTHVHLGFGVSVDLATPTCSLKPTRQTTVSWRDPRLDYKLSTSQQSFTSIRSANNPKPLSHTMPVPPGEMLVEGMAVVNTEVDYREEEDSILVDPDAEKPAQADGPGEVRSGCPVLDRR